MHLTPRTGCSWVMNCWCCGLRASSVLVCCLYLLLHTLFLITNFLILRAPEQHVNSIIQFIDTSDSRLQESNLYSEVKPYLVRNSGEYLALPITVNLVLLVTNLLAGFGALASLPLLLLPWILFYLLYTLFAASLLVYMMVLLQDLWFRVLLFLVVSPLLVMHSACWCLLVRLYSAIRGSSKPSPAAPPPRPPTMYTPEPHAWDQPLPIWAIAPPQNAWDPSYLQQIDPRYRERSRSRSRRSSSRSRSQPSTAYSVGYRQSDSVSLSDKYGERRGYGEQEDRYETEFTEDQSEEQSEEPSVDEEEEGVEYRTEEERTEVGEETEGVSEEETEGVSEEETEEEDTLPQTQDPSQQYWSPRTERPKSRSSTVSGSDRYRGDRSSLLGGVEECTVSFTRQSH